MRLLWRRTDKGAEIELRRQGRFRMYFVGTDNRCGFVNCQEGEGKWGDSQVFGSRGPERMTQSIVRPG